MITTHNDTVPPLPTGEQTPDVPTVWLNGESDAFILHDLETLFALQDRIAALPDQRDAAILQALPPVYQARIRGVMRECDRRRDQIEAEANELRRLLNDKLTQVRRTDL